MVLVGLSRQSPWYSHGNPLSSFFGCYNPYIGGFKPSFFMGFWGLRVICRKGFIYSWLILFNHQHSPPGQAMESHVDQKNIIPDLLRHDVWSVGISEDHLLKHILHKKSQVLLQNVHHFEIRKSVSPYQRESPQKSSNLHDGQSFEWLSSWHSQNQGPYDQGLLTIGFP